MFDYLMGLILIGLGIQSPVIGSSVKGDQTEHVQEATDEAEIEDHTSTDSAKEDKRKNIIKKFLPDNIKWLEQGKWETKTASRSGSKDKHEVFRQKLRDDQERFRSSFEEHKASAEAQLQIKKEEFELKLALFKDESKKTKIENIQQRFEESNKKLTDRATENLAKISELLDKIIEKVQVEKTNNKDTTAVDTAISAAQTYIGSAQNAISAQALKTYVVPVTIEDNAQSDTVTTIKKLSADAKAMHEAVVSARKTVSTVIRELAKLRGEPVPDAVIK